MYALSIKQPWAWLIACGLKNIENRDWPTNFRGKFYIHASKSMTRADYDACRIFVDGLTLPQPVQLPAPGDLYRGYILGTAELTDCVRAHPSPWFCGEYGFVLQNGKSIPPISYKGALGFFKVGPTDLI
jgi:hypothetical protein